MRILAIIPARGGTKGVPGKNIKVLGGKPLIAYTIESALQSALLTTVIVSTDSLEIMEIAQQWKAEVPFQRPPELAEDDTASLAVVQHALGFYEEKGEVFDAVCLLQPTSPFREGGGIDAAIQQFMLSNADALVSVLPVPHEFNPHWTFETNDKGFLKIATGENELITRRQELPKAFHRDGSIYITKIETIKKGSLYGQKLSYIESNPNFYVNIDTADDWINAENLLKNY
ncbi:cytidylyltransferase domain-containing protein [Flavobacterium frigoris]|uniref:N-Acetylneuraminate cytidylyltransferase n=1 Tax=Flavobacterium frigoris (strain PS1) TaxID=1086011 RepID=H7FM73_FLAFP|nr:acylneuraminate cytidylyltransferase family protein [Flavobacterium frigoris]EIA10411.1 N-Acetylneuraminate cytidylyltransferase [Flavobacterium frigoris PS1]